MSTVSELIEILKTKDQTALVEYIVCKKDGEIITCDVATQAKPIIKMLKLFN